MRRICVYLATAVLLLPAVRASEGTGRNLTCCEAAAAEGRECTHRCCLTAHRAGLSCAKCNPAGEDLKPTRNARTFYIQLVRGSNKEIRSATATPAGLKLKQKLASVFKWKRYWELHRDSVTLAPGQKVRRSLSEHRQVELELSDPNTLCVRIYQNGQCRRSRTQPAEGVFCVTGGDEQGEQSWFIIVRGDHPDPPAKS